MSTGSSNDPSPNNTETAIVYHPSSSYNEASNGQSHTSFNYQKSYPPAEAEFDEIAQNPEIFLEKLKGFHGSFGTKFKVPTMGGKALDLHRLFLEVTSRGGIEKVINDRKWKEVISIFNFPPTITSASFVLRKYYLSLLYHFEQVYYFRKEVLSISPDDPASRIPVNGSAAPHVFEDGATTNQLAGHVNFVLEPGSMVTGTIDSKFDVGYLITVNLGSEKLKGVLYQTPTPLHASQNFNTSAAPPHRNNHKRYQLALRDPSRPQPSRSGYNFFFAEHYNRLNSLHQGQEKAISKNIEVLWSRLTDAEKQVYEDKGLRDEERYRSEMS
ncbi:unnamed protein product [Camellia sinensis]